VRQLFGAAGNLLARIGTYSYSIYLWHLVAASLGLTLFRRFYAKLSVIVPSGLMSQQPQPLIAFAAYVAGSVASGIIRAKLVEMPVLKLRDRYFPGRG
jgi:peptidoglycan/LPS O-acetylase OafA/YrhL